MDLFRKTWLVNGPVVYVGKVLVGTPFPALLAKVGFKRNVSGILGTLSKAVNFVWSRCQNGTGNNKNITEKVVLAGSCLKVVNRFCYRYDMLDAGGGAESRTVTRVYCGWNKFRELLPLLTTKAVS